MSRRFLAALVIAACVPPGLRAQAPAIDSAVAWMFANDEWERYTRILQVSGDVALYPWSIRGFGRHELQRLKTRAAHPWSAVYRGTQRGWHWLVVSGIPVGAEGIYNSAFPYGMNDGAVWAGRGLTTAIRGGIVAQAGPVSMSLAPIVFRSENGDFALRPTGIAGPNSYGDAFYSQYIDRPQRFGEGAYQQFSFGNSFVRVDAGPVTLGFSSADQAWGPAVEHPLVLGTNAPGFPHVFVGTGSPVDLWIAKLHTRMVWGRLEHSEYTDFAPRSRLASALIATVTPRGVPGLELGGARFFHILWTDDVLGWENLLRPLSGLLKISRIRVSGDPQGTEGDNQLASLFARWVFPSARFEAYAEFLREDHSWNMRDFIVEPDHAAAFVFGMQRVFDASPIGRRVVRGEIVNARLSPLALVRPQAPMYQHSVVREGHTNLGQVLGSVAAPGGGGSVLGLDNYSSTGRWSVTWSRTNRAEDTEQARRPAGEREPDVIHAFSLSGRRHRGSLALRYELTALYELNRNLLSDVAGWRTALGAELSW